MQSQSETRKQFIKANPGVRLPGYGGYWYRCANCGKWCGRQGSDNIVIPDDCKMEVDHIIPWSKSQCDALSNLQPLCKPCNRNKSANQSGFESTKAIVNATKNGDLGQLVGGILLTKVENKLGYKPKRY